MNAQLLNALQVLRDNGLSGSDVEAAYASLPPPTQGGGSTPCEADLRYTLPDIPPDIATHFVDGTPQTLSVAVAWPGFSYTLTRGQRNVLREAYGMTPTQTVTCTHVERWPGTKSPRAITLRSDEHIDPRRRTHVLSHVNLTRPGEFFAQASELDEAARRERVFGLTPTTLTLGRVFDLESVERWAAEDITGVKLHKRVEITLVNDTHFTLSCQRTGNTTCIPKGTFFEMVDEYAALHKTPRISTRSSGDAAALLSIIASLEGATQSLP